MPEVREETGVLGDGVFLVTAVGLAVKLAVLQVTAVVQLEAPTAMAQGVALMLPEGLLIGEKVTVTF